MTSLSNSGWQNRKERQNLSTDNKDMADRAMNFGNHNQTKPWGRHNKGVREYFSFNLTDFRVILTIFTLHIYCLK